MKKILPIIAVLFLLTFSYSVFAQAPTLSYATPNTYTVGVPIPALAPTSTGVATPNFSATLIAVGSALNGPAGVAVDAAGNVYVACYYSSLIEKIPVGGGPTVTLGSGFYHPYDVKVDAAGNVFVADFSNNAVKEIPVGGGSVITIGSGFSFPAAIALDKAGNVYVADPGHGLVKKVPANGGAISNLGSFNNPFGVAVDGQGIVYVTDATNKLYEIPPGGGAFQVLLSGLNNPNGIWADPSGNIYVTDTNNGLVKMVPSGGGTPVTLPFTLSSPNGLATDAAGTLYIADPSYGSVFKVGVTGGYYIAPSLPQGLLFNTSTGVISGTPTAVSAATNYTVTAWNGSGSKAATFSLKVNLPAAPTLSYTTPQTYTTGSAITPLLPTKTNIQPLNYSTTPLVLGSGFTAPEGVAVDPAGNVYVAEAIQNKLIKIPAGNGTPVVLATGFNLIGDVAIDKSGNLYVTDYFNNEIKEFVGGTGAPVILGSGFYHPYGVAVDAAGNVYVGDQGNNMVKKIPAGNKPVVILATGLYIPDGLCTDAAGNVYFADLGNNAIKKIPVGGGPPVAVGTGFTQPVSVACDAAGNLFVTDRNNNAIKEIYAGTNTTVTISAGFNFPVGICVDSKGDVFVGDYGNQQVKEIKPVGGYFINALPLGLSFDETTGIISGTPSVVTAATNYTVTAYNAGASKQATLSISTVAPATSALSALTVSNGALSPVFSTGTTSYAVSVTNPLTSIKFTPTVQTAGATIKVNGVAVVSGAASQAIPLSVGQNVVNIVVTAPGASSTSTYTVLVTRQLSNNDNLSAVALSSGTLTPAFAAATLNYKATVSTATTSITVTPTSAVTGETISVNGTAVTSGSASGAITLNYGVNTITVSVIAPDGVTLKNYVIAVTRTASTNAALSALTVSNGTLTPAFATGTKNYAVGVGNGLASITVTPTTADATSTITVNGTAVISGHASQSIPLVVGANAISVVVTAQDGTTKSTYAVTVNEAKSTNANLSALKPGTGAIAPAFSPTTTSYTETVNNAVTSITVTPTTAVTTSTVTVNGTTVASATASPAIPLNVGSNVISTIVTAQSGATKTYTITVTRQPSTDASLANIVLSNGSLVPAFASGTTSYTTSVGNGLASMTVTPTTTDPNSTITVNGSAVTSGSASQSIPLVVGTNNITIAVTAQDGVTKRTYTIVVTEAKSTNNNLLSLKPSTGALSPAFAPATITYTESVANTVTSFKVTPTTVVSSATITVNGTAVTSGSASGAIALSVGANTISTVVTAQSGATKTYTVTVTRAAGPIASYDPGIIASKPALGPTLADDGILVHQGITPNGDGINDFLQIDNISQYPNNNLSIINRNGQLVYQAKGYDNSSKVFDGRSNKTGQMQLPGTYFYQLDYTVNGITKHKTGYLVLKY